ncbi:TPA: hypothetical protein QHL18_000192 [Enterobacter hormaechei subsp. steigerwaltii]|uniref:hypothetical protein n=3 Tax=Enterobacteriaceae TaxID=543 RepID=UPI000573BFE4|nr:hypothetical protein [Enterobacter hormaechei]AKZ84683.1 hypothetical protein LI65_013940 [Enterobacter hormaechei subsp. steigerwaltii]MBT2063557.1 hypothetical protein [Enterobacter hormaechei subsp. xiangfangensis]PAC69187.1 hypothetical protein CGS27_17675 [Enterobacter cloacae]EKY3910373.1 hypothetical protein [Enterobacter hormaechei]ELC6434610.1 hypothetical protein [Enterobacter hormaechei]
MSIVEDIFKVIGAASGLEQIRTDSDPTKTSQSKNSNPKTESSKGSGSAEEKGKSETSDGAAPSEPDDKAEREAEEFGSNTGALHEFMQQNRMDSLQAQLDMLKSGVRDKIADANGKEIDNVLRKKMASFTFSFMVCWCLFVGTMFVSYLIAHEGKPPPETMIALLGTSTLSIVGLVGFVVSGLFKSRKEGSEKEK